jgi:hypothetical protein
MKIILRVTLILFVALLNIAPSEAQNQGFNLIVVGDPQPQTEAQITSLEEEIIPQIATIVEQYKTSDYPTAILLTGDNVWDTMRFMPRIKEAFESLGVPLYSVIGNHDHDRRVKHNQTKAERHYTATFGPRNQHFMLGETLFVTLDNIEYATYHDYTISIDNEQLAWLEDIVSQYPNIERVAVCMHAPASKISEPVLRPYAEPIVKIIGERKIEFITGHAHRHATVDIAPNIVEHSVAQVNGNLWFAPICADGTPGGVFCIEERNGEWSWQHRILGQESDYQMRIWSQGELREHEEYIVVKAIGWDEKWMIRWSENGKDMGVMEQIEIIDPDYSYYVEYEADYRKKFMTRLRRSARPARHYFRCRPTDKNSEITITATDRFGRTFSISNKQ